MPTNKDTAPSSPPTPPVGYNLINLPDFIRPANKDTKAVPAARRLVPGGMVAAEVMENNPHTILVREPQLFTQPVQTHESTHVYQLGRNPQFVDNAISNLPTNSPNSYDYGGIEGLEQALKQGKTIANFDMEKQAQMVADFQRMTTEALQKGDRRALARVTAAYHPFVSQLSKIPPKGADMTKMTKQDLTPVPPSLPPATVIGVPMMPDSLLGSSTGPKVGEKKKHPNGKMGVWDGYGWRAQ